MVTKRTHGWANDLFIFIKTLVLALEHCEWNALHPFNFFQQSQLYTPQLLRWEYAIIMGRLKRVDKLSTNCLHLGPVVG